MMLLPIPLPFWECVLRGGSLYIYIFFNFSFAPESHSVVGELTEALTKQADREPSFLSHWFIPPRPASMFGDPGVLQDPSTTLYHLPPAGPSLISLPIGMAAGFPAYCPIGGIY